MMGVEVFHNGSRRRVGARQRRRSGTTRRDERLRAPTRSRVTGSGSLRRRIDHGHGAGARVTHAAHLVVLVIEGMMMMMVVKEMIVMKIERRVLRVQPRPRVRPYTWHHDRTLVRVVNQLRPISAARWGKWLLLLLQRRAFLLHIFGLLLALLPVFAAGIIGGYHGQSLEHGGRRIVSQVGDHGSL